MTKYKVYVPVHSGFEVIVEAENEEAAEELVLSGEFDSESQNTDQQILENQQADTSDVVVEEVK